MKAILLAFVAVAGQAAPVSWNEPAWVGAVAFSPDGKWLATGCADSKARLREVGTGKEVAVLAAHKDYVVSVAFSPNGQLLATGSFDHTARLWDVRTKQLRSTLEGHRGAVMSVAFSRDGAWVASGSIDSTIHVWDVATGKSHATLHGHKSWVNSVVFGNDDHLISGSSDGTIRFWRAPKFDLVHMLDATNTEIRSIAVSADGKTLAAGIRYGAIRTWISNKPHLTFKAHEGDVWSVAFSPDGKTLASGDGDWNKPGQVKLWDTASGKLVQTMPHTGEVLSVAWSPDGKAIAAGGWDKAVTTWPVREH